MINTDDFGRVTVGGMIDKLFAEYSAAGRAIMRGALAEGYDERILSAMFELCFAEVMEIRKEITWIFDENPKQDGDYLYAQFGIKGDLLILLTASYTKKYGWNSSMYSGGDKSWGQNPSDDGSYAWAELPFK